MISDRYEHRPGFARPFSFEPHWQASKTYFQPDFGEALPLGDCRTYIMNAGARQGPKHFSSARRRQGRERQDGGKIMNLEKYSERVRGFIQSAQSLALREGHQQFTPEHVLKVLLDDDQGLAAGLIDRAGGRSREALVQTEIALSKLPKVQGAGAGQLYLAPTTARIFDNAEKIAQKAGDSFVTVERLLLALAMEKGSEAAKDPRQRRRHAADAQRRDRGIAQGPHRRQRERRKHL